MVALLLLPLLRAQIPDPRTRTRESEKRANYKRAQSTGTHEQWELRSAAEALTEAEHMATYEATATCSSGRSMLICFCPSWAIRCQSEGNIHLNLWPINAEMPFEEDDHGPVPKVDWIR